MKNVTVTALQHNVRSALAQVRREGAAAVVGARGQTTAYLVNRATYEALQRRMALLEGLARGERAIQEGRVLSHGQVKKKLGRWLKK